MTVQSNQEHNSFLLTDPYAVAWAVPKHTDTSKNTSKNTKDILKLRQTLNCNVLHSYVGTIVSHDKLLE